MIDFKYHVVSLISVFLAIALGIILGTTVLNGPITNDLKSSVQSLKNDKRTLEGQVDILGTQVSQNDQFDAAVAPGLVTGVLKDQSFITITTGSSVTAQMRDNVIKMVQASGAKNTGAISLDNNYSDPAQGAIMLKFATTNLPAGVTVADSSDPGTVTGSLIANLIVPGASTQPGATITSVLSGFGGLGVLKLDSADLTPSKNVVIITSGVWADKPADRDKSILSLALALDKAGANVVIAGDVASAGPNGVINAARADASVASIISTVDNANYASGQVSVVWALADEAKQKTGQYGSSKGTQPIPPKP